MRFALLDVPRSSPRHLPDLDIPIMHPSAQDNFVSSIHPILILSVQGAEMFTSQSFSIRSSPGQAPRSDIKIEVPTGSYPKEGMMDHGQSGAN